MSRWKRTPEWCRTVEKVKALEIAGVSPEDISKLTKENAHVVKRIVEDEEYADQWARRCFDQKVPTIKRIITLSLSGVEDQLTEMQQDPELRRKMLSKATDVVALGELAIKLNNLLRLEMGESTQNISTKVEHTYNKTRVILQKLKNKDPVFDYPSLPESPISGTPEEGTDSKE